MTSKRVIGGAVLAGILVAVPVFAQEARRRDPGDRGNRGGDRNSSRVEQRREASGGGETRSAERRYAAPRHPSGTSYNRQVERQRQEARQEAPRQIQSPRQVQAPPVADAPRASDGGRRYAAPRQYERRDSNVRAYQAPRANTRSYESTRRYDSAPRRYDNSRSYYSNRGYSGHKYPSYSHGYNHHYSKPYLYRGYRGAYGYGRHIHYVRPYVVTVVPYRPYYYRPRWGLSVYYGAGGAYPYGYTPSYYYNPIAGRPYGGVRIVDAPREAQVFVDGYYVGIVDDFDGAFQHVNLEAGAHRVEIQAPGIDPLGFDVMVQAGRTITLRADAYGYGNGYYGGNGY
jgi:hypothetical protein